jgi:hypothetical protein
MIFEGSVGDGIMVIRFSKTVGTYSCHGISEIHLCYMSRVYLWEAIFSVYREQTCLAAAFDVVSYILILWPPLTSISDDD